MTFLKSCCNWDYLSLLVLVDYKMYLFGFFLKGRGFLQLVMMGWAEDMWVMGVAVVEGYMIYLLVDYVQGMDHV